MSENLPLIERLVASHGRQRAALIPILQGIQHELGFLDPQALRRLCELSEITPADIAGVASFYTQFRHRPVGKHMISVCHGTACHVKGSGLVHEAFLRELKIDAGNDTDANGLFTVQKVACLGCCTLAPAVQIDGVTYGHLTQQKVAAVLTDFLTLQKNRKTSAPLPAGDADASAGEIRLGMGSCCQARGSAGVLEAISHALVRSGSRAKVHSVGCVGVCHQTPLVEVVQPGGTSKLYAQVKAQDAEWIVRRHFKPRNPLRRLAGAVSVGLEKLLTDDAWNALERYETDVRDPRMIAFLGPQKHIATEHCGVLEPLDLEGYRKVGGFEALRRCLTELTPDAVIAEVTASGLRGRGGAGFPTGRKWSLARAARGDVKYVICNGDEGDPGAFMDRMLLESYPFRVIEGLLIAARAVDATEGVFYIRDEYPLAVQRVEHALRICREQGLVGENILGSGYSLSVRIMRGAGAFVCGEETALIASVEGRRGMPRLRPPFPAESGLHGKPTLVNNVETFATVPWIIRNGGAKFAQMGTAGSKGTKVFALAGKVAFGGLVEVPMGVTIGQIVEQIGGGIGEGRRFKAVQIGGPSGGCVPAALADTPIDYQALADVGAIMGSGGMVVLDDRDCMVDIARYFLEFTQDQSCGKCTFCRIGTRRMLEILQRLCEGKAQAGEVDDLERLAHDVRSGSLCGLGKTAPNPVLTTLRYFRDEYDAHVQGRCPAGKCKALVHYRIDDAKCIGCTLCAQHCPVAAIAPAPYKAHDVDDAKCTRCDACRQVCPTDAVRVD